jgi:hydrogenase maturation factor HypF (carbamoyltransferase family)
MRSSGTASSSSACSTITPIWPHASPSTGSRGQRSAVGGRRSAVGGIYDGTGYGLDGSVWGGELLVGDLCEFARAGSLWPVRMPGGAQAIKEPWRMAFA